MKQGRICTAVTGLSLGILLLYAVFAPVASAGRPVLNESPDTIERYFGRPMRPGTGTPSQTFILYSPLGLQAIVPQATVFSIYFSQQRAKQVVIKFFLPTSYGQNEASALFNYIFADNPTMWKEIRRENLSTANGQRVTNFAYCVANGIENEFTAYDSSVDYISFKINSRCRMPEPGGNAR